MVRIIFKIMSLNEVISKSEFIKTLGKVETFSSDLGIFFL
jgi:hypothetical protein